MSQEIYTQKPELRQAHLLDQYKLCVEMADRVSARRNAANVFFLSLNTTIVAAIGFTIDKIKVIDPEWVILFPLLGVLTFCLVWWWLIRSYRNLNTAKYKVIGKMEEELPFSPYWKEEWKELGEGKDIKKYLPLTVIEQWVPIIFAGLYVMVTFYVLIQ